jgi:hypothetical protein
MSGFFSGPPVEGIDGITCDYMGNDGVIREVNPLFGTVRLRVGALVRERRLHEVTDGTSQTLLFWECIGDALRSQRSKKLPADIYAPNSFYYNIDKSSSNNLACWTQASYKSYIFSWTGFRIGGIYEENGHVMNYSNVIGQPFSSHSGLLPCCMTDGSVTSVAESIDNSILMAMATADSGELVQQE